MLEANEVRRKEMEGAAWRRFLRDVAYNLQHGAADERTAVRWILDAHDLSREHDTGYICYCLGLSYDKAPLFEDYVVEYFGEKEVDFA
jgi:hypothetical protein